MRVFQQGVFMNFKHWLNRSALVALVAVCQISGHRRTQCGQPLRNQAMMAKMGDASKRLVVATGQPTDFQTMLNQLGHTPPKGVMDIDRVQADPVRKFVIEQVNHSVP